MQRLRESRSQLLRERGRRDPGFPARAEQMVVRLVADTRRDRGIRQDNVDLVQPQGGKQVVERSLPAQELRRLLQLEDSIQQTLRDLLWQHVVDADDQAKRPLRRPTGEGIQEVVAERAKQLGNDFVLKTFMDDFLASGLIPISLIRWELTGVERVTELQ